MIDTIHKRQKKYGRVCNKQFIQSVLQMSFSANVVSGLKFNLLSQPRICIIYTSFTGVSNAVCLSVVFSYAALHCSSFLCHRHVVASTENPYPFHHVVSCRSGRGWLQGGVLQNGDSVEGGGDDSGQNNESVHLPCKGRLLLLDFLHLGVIIATLILHCDQVLFWK